MQPFKKEAKLSIVMIDSNHLLGEGLKILLNDLNMDLELFPYRSDSISLPEVFSKHMPDIIMIEINNQKNSFYTELLTFTCRFPSAKVMIYFVTEEREQLLKAFKSGAVGYLSKRTEKAMFTEAFVAVNQGQFYVCPWLAPILLAEIKLLNQQYHHTKYFSIATAAPPIGLLTKRELEFIPLIAKGMSNKVIGETLNITEKTVKNHIFKILKKLVVRDRTQVALKAIKSGWVKL